MIMQCACFIYKAILCKKYEDFFMFCEPLFMVKNCKMYSGFIEEIVLRRDFSASEFTFCNFLLNLLHQAYEK